MKFIQFNPKNYIGEKFRACRLCGNRLYPESLKVEKDGEYFCQSHYSWRFDKRESDIPFDIPIE